MKATIRIGSELLRRCAAIGLIALFGCALIMAGASPLRKSTTHRCSGVGHSYAIVIGASKSIKVIKDVEILAEPILASRPVSAPAAKVSIAIPSVLPEYFLQEYFSERGPPMTC